MRTPAKHRLLVAYDIRLPKRAVQARQTLRAYSGNAQKSVFEAALSTTQQKSLLHDLHCLEHESDDWLVVQIDPRATVVRLGAGHVNATDPENFSYWG